ncbi:MAG TPA: sulfur carrier protein ThiS [Polyangiales bacterium]|nr:sulfur carrier protein ThiS [Polyangiales bacterium]
MQIEVNGEVRQVAPELTVSALLALLGVGDGPVAVERNRQIVPRAEHPNTQLADGDKLEVVHFVGGG